MIDLDVLNYFVVILGGFGVVWSFRHFTGRSKEKIGEFEYAALSTLWGIPLAVILLVSFAVMPQNIHWLNEAPMFFTWPLFLLGLGFGWIAAQIKLYWSNRKDGKPVKR
jgi:hypothetical protein